MAGLADGSASLSMSGREELMALKQTGCCGLSLSLSLSQWVSMSLSRTQHLLLTEVLPRLERKKDIKPLFPLTDRLSLRKPAAFDIFWDTHSRLHSARPLGSKCLRVLSLIGI